VTSVVGNFGDLWIWNNYALESLDGLNNITSVGNGQLWTEGNTVLKDLKGLMYLTWARGFVCLLFRLKIIRPVKR